MQPDGCVAAGGQSPLRAAPRPDLPCPLNHESLRLKAFLVFMLGFSSHG
jgi:hypothetical protein